MQLDYIRLFAPLLLGRLLHLARDKVANVRLALARTLAETTRLNGMFYMEWQWFVLLTLEENGVFYYIVLHELVVHE